ncbi:MAG TPA: heparan-alpha-glucosaminide N-acetyltransferase domain-containing protein [Gemmatimonadaceae bacterium]|nr:heparan-alpha-glucosaminide N-acetyltransferase domain-containing protein [Gemmatimonadaceae bacterium]
MPVADDGYEAQHLSLLRRSVAVGATSAAGVTTREAGLTTYSADTAPSRASSRIGSIDVVRGLIMVLMAIDHVRVYSGVPAGGPTPGVFFTRWVTHFCAPGFAFFAGTSAFLYGRKRDPSTLARFLVERGPILVALELTYLHVAWTFGFNFSTMLAGVIWMLGWCMVILAAFVRLSPATVGGIGVGIMALQTLMRPLAQAFPAAKVVWQFLYLGGGAHVGVDVIVLYNIIPWIGVMMAGYGFGAIMVREPADRDRWCLRIGVTMTALFLVVGSFLAATHAQDGVPFLFRLLGQNKYRDSQLFLLMTLGPTIAVLPYADRARGRVSRALATFGRVPMFYYLLHIPLIHALSLVAWKLRDGTTHFGWFANAPYVETPNNQRWSLLLLYVVYAVVIALAYPLCRWYGEIKRRNPQSILKYF